MSRRGDAAAPLAPPACSDRALWDLWLGRLLLPVVASADELGLFSLVSREPLALGQITARLELSERGAEAMVAVLCSLGLLRKLGGRFHLTDVSREFLVPDSPYYWGGVLSAYRQTPEKQDPIRLTRALRVHDPELGARTSDLWQMGEMPRDTARLVTAYMHAHSFPAAIGLARHADLSRVGHVFDVGAGSGCFSIALALRYPAARFTLLDLPPVCEAARDYVAQYGLSDRIATAPLDMFKDPWPSGGDAVLLSNILHDWDDTQCRALLERAFAALPAGGRVFVHEVLFDDDCTGDLAAAAFSLQMAAGTHGRQRALPELSALLLAAGFRDPQCTHSFGHYWLLSAQKVEGA